MNDLVSSLFKEKLLDTLDAFDSFCTQHDLNYYACAGSALGAVRHNNIIPWDDDIDVFMPRDDYDAFLRLYSSDAICRYRIAKPGDNNYIYSYAKFYDATTTVIEWERYPDCVVGVWIDVFPLDEEYRSRDETFTMKERYMKLYRKFQYTFYSLNFRVIASLIKGGEYQRAFDIMSSRYASKRRKNAIREQFLSFERSWRGKGGDMMLCHVGMYSLERELFPKQWIQDWVYFPFGKTHIRVMANYHDYLTNLFGDYMTPPPIEQQVTHHSHYYLNLKEGLSLEETRERIKHGEFLVI